MKKEAEYFGDIVILPFLDRYDLVVLKTFAICEYGVSFKTLFLSCIIPNLDRYHLVVRCMLCPVRSQMYRVEGEG
jgi:hypothetical protein